MYGHCYIIIQRIFSTLNPSVTHLFILPLISSMGQTLIFLLSPWFALSRMSYGWNYVAWWLIVRLAYFTCEYELNFLHIFHGLIAPFFLAQNSIPLLECASFYLPLQLTFWLLPSFDNDGWSCYKHPCAAFCVDIIFQFLWVNTKEHDLDCMVRVYLIL